NKTLSHHATGIRLLNLAQRRHLGKKSRIPRLAVDSGHRRSTQLWMCDHRSRRTGHTHFNRGGTNMVRGLLIGGLLLALTSANYADDKSATPKLPTPPTNAALEKLKKLAGTWVTADNDGKPTDNI